MDEELRIISASLNIADGLNMSVASARELDLAREEVRSYIERCLAKLMDDAALKQAEFRGDSAAYGGLARYADGECSLAGLTREFVERYDALLKNETAIPSGDLFTGIAEIAGERFFFLLKLCYRPGYTHSVQNDGGIAVDLVRHQALLPPAGGESRRGRAHFPDRLPDTGS